MDIKKNTDFFIGKKLRQVRFGLYQMQLYFEDEILIEIGAGIVYSTGNGNNQIWSYTDSKNIFSINNLLEETIGEAVVDDVDNLRLSFENGENLEIKAAKDGNESYIIYYKQDFQVIY